MKTSRKLLCMLLTLLMLISLLPAAALANTAVDYTIQIAPAAVTLTVSGGTLTDGGVQKISERDYHVYTLSAEPGSTITYSGADGTVDLGSGTLKLDTTAATYRFARHNFYASYGKGMEDWTLTGFSDKTDAGNVVSYTLGEKFNDNGTAKQCALLLGGHKYGGTVTMNDALEETCYLGSFADFTVSATVNAAQNKTLPINQYKIIKVTAPTAATTTFYKQDANYVVEPVTPDSTAADAEAGTTTYLFKGTAAHSNYQFRSMMPGKMTQAGYLADGNDITVSFSDIDGYSTTSAMAYDDNSVLLNVKTGDKLVGQNKLNLSVGETFKLRAFRGAWEIINTSSGNQMIEPDFHAAILSGYDVVSIVPTTECTNSKFPNAKNGNATGNWMNVTALKKGTAVVAVWYDAINVYNANPPAANDWSVFGATAPERYGVFVVSVGDDSSVTWNPASHDGDWDAEFDVVYYNGDAGCFTFAPDEDVTGVTVQNVYGTTLGAAQTVTASVDGSYAVPVTTGANIIAVTTADGTDYQVVRAKKISYTITNNTTHESAVNGVPAISTEDSVTISFDKLDMPIPKMSGIYNPGYLGTAKTAYELNDSLLLTSAGTQYDFSTKNSITFIAHVAGENSLKGYINLSSMGDPFGNHRNITDDGKPVNTNAAEVFGDFGVLPDITFTVTDNGAKASYEDATKITSLTVKGANSTGYLTGFANWTKVEDGNSNWTAATSAMTAYTLTANVVTKDYNNKLQLRYWYDGEEEQTADLIAGATNTINGFTLDANKILNLQVVITPADPTLGDAKTYTYIVYPGNANLKYVHPVIKSLTAKNGDETLVMKPVLNTADTAYTLCVGDAEKISLSGEQLIKIYNTAVTADQSDSVVLTKMKDGSPVGDSITILEAGAPTNPNRYWVCDELDITDADALRIVVTSYVDNANARTYTFTLDRTAVSEDEKKAQSVDALINALGEVTLAGESAIAAARSAYAALTKTQKALVTKEGVLTAAEARLAYLKRPAPAQSAPDGVTFRLIGSTKATADVDLSKGTEGYNGAKYVTWVKTTHYTLENGDTVGTLFERAMADAGLSYVGLDSGYISSVTAPAACGGYALTEMDNGVNSGWMYTVNGAHPDRGLNDWTLFEGDSVVWHYVDDYSYEVSDWSGSSRGDSSVWNKWLDAADITPGTMPEYSAKTEDSGQPGEKPAEKETPTRFEDVPEDVYYTDAVRWAAANGITSGTDETHFSPDADCTRGQMVTFLWRAAGCPKASGKTPFTDVAADAYYSEAVTWAYEKGVTGGTGATTFSPDAVVNRAQVVTFLYRYEKPTQSTASNPFTDVVVGTYYYDAVLWAAANGFTSGTDAAHFSPDTSCTRGQIVTFLYRDFTDEPSGSSRGDAPLAEAAAYVLKTTPTPRFGSVGGEWAVLGLARSGYAVPADYYSDYYAALEKTVSDAKGVLSTRKYTEYSRAIVALTAIGKDARNVAGYDLTMPLGDYEKTIYQGTSGPVWALIALDSRDYPMPVCPDAATPATRQMYIDRLLETQNADGGWGIGATSASDIDMTAMALQTLANYQEQKAVAAATEKALAFLSGKQDANGSYASWGGATSESTVQVIVALCTLGIDLEDSRFVKNGHTLLDDLNSYRVSGGGYAHVRGGEVNQMASEQALYALAAVQRAQTGMPGLYDMTK